MKDSSSYDISSANIRVNVYYNDKFDHFIGIGTVCKVFMGTDGAIHIDTIMLDSGTLICRAGLAVVPIGE